AVLATSRAGLTMVRRAFKHFHGQWRPSGGQLVQASRPDTADVKVALGRQVVVHARLPEPEQIVHADNFIFHAGDFGNLDNLAGTAGQAGNLHDNVNGGGQLAADDPDGDVEASHADHHFQPAQGVARLIGMDGGQAAVVASVHGLEHVEGFGAAALADDD